MKKVCVIGWPIGHSRSPLIHNYWLKKYGIDAVYEKKPIESQNVANFVATLSTSEFIGCNVTIPHKETVFGTVDVADEIARRLGAVNTVYLRSNKVCGTNTDGEGFIASLHHSYPSFGLAGRTAIIIGAGGAAKAITGALLDENIEKIGIINRTRERIRSLQKQFGSRLFAVNAPIADHEL